jgi:hypothetical protein
MKNLNVFLLSLIFISCGRLAQVPVVENFTFEEQTIIPFSTNSLVSPMVRAATIVVVPEREDVKGLVFNPLDGSTAAEWTDLYSNLDYSDYLPGEFTLDMPIDQKILGASEIVMAAGSIRDQYLRNLSTLESEFSQKEEDVRAYEDSAGLTDITCYYASRPSRGTPYTCRFDEDAASGFTRTKTFYSCENWVLFSLDANQEVHVQFQKYAEIAQNCEGLQAELDEINTIIQSRKLTRLSAENVVLDLLLETEKVTDLVFAAKAATIEKPDSIGEESSLVFSADKMSVEEFKLFVDFLPGNSSKVGYAEYSIANGLIRDVSVYVSDLGVKKLKFTLELPDMTFVVNADISVEKMPIGFRVIDSAAKVEFNNGKSRKGVFKLEFDTVKL